MGNFIEEFYYCNIDPQARSTKQNKSVQKQMEVLMLNEEFLTEALSDEKEQPIGIWGRRHARYLKQHHKVLYMNLLTSGKLNGYLADLDKQAENMFFQLVKQMTEREGVTEKLKAENQMEWVGRMNNIRACTTEIVNNEIIYI